MCRYIKERSTIPEKCRKFEVLFLLFSKKLDPPNKFVKILSIGHRYIAKLKSERQH
jgi:hypothetical protein